MTNFIEMKVILVMLLSIGNPLGTPTTGEVRGLYQNAVVNEKVCQELIAILAPYKENENPLLYGYKAGATMMMAKHVFNPISKLNYFNKGKKMLNDAITAQPKNVELRVLRFLAQSNTPSFLGYNDAINSDERFILSNFSTIETKSTQEYLFSMLKNTLSKEDIHSLKRQIKK